MTSITSETGHETGAKAGTITIVRTPDGGNKWAYVLATLPGSDVVAAVFDDTVIHSVRSVESVGVYPVGIAVERLLTNELAAAQALVSYFRSAVPNLDAPSEDVQAAYQRGRREVEREVEAWKEMATETAHRYADNNNLCGEFDRCMEEIGLQPRERDYAVTISVEVQVTVGATGRNDEDAAERALETFRDDPRTYLEAVDWSYASLEVDDVEAD